MDSILAKPPCFASNEPILVLFAWPVELIDYCSGHTWNTVIKTARDNRENGLRRYSDGAGRLAL
jgi:hypothetical protein